MIMRAPLLFISLQQLQAHSDIPRRAAFIIRRRAISFFASCDCLAAILLQEPANNPYNLEDDRTHSAIYLSVSRR
jgi:hypothetical protein